MNGKADLVADLLLGDKGPDLQTVRRGAVIREPAASGFADDGCGNHRSQIRGYSSA